MFLKTVYCCFKIIKIRVPRVLISIIISFALEPWECIFISKNFLGNFRESFKYSLPFYPGYQIAIAAAKAGDEEMFNQYKKHLGEEHIKEAVESMFGDFELRLELIEHYVDIDWDQYFSLILKSENHEYIYYIIAYCISPEYYRQLWREALAEQNYTLLSYFDRPNSVLIYACKKDIPELAKFAINTGADDWDYALNKALKHGNDKIAEIIWCSADCPTSVVYRAGCTWNKPELIEHKKK